MATTAENAGVRKTAGAPAPIVADALGYHHVTTAKLAAQSGGTWSRYAPRDHSPSSSDQAQPSSESATVE